MKKNINIIMKKIYRSMMYIKKELSVTVAIRLLYYLLLTLPSKEVFVDNGCAPPDSHGNASGS